MLTVIIHTEVKERGKREMGHKWYREVDREGRNTREKKREREKQTDKQRERERERETEREGFALGNSCLPSFPPLCL